MSVWNGVKHHQLFSQTVSTGDKKTDPSSPPLASSQANHSYIISYSELLSNNKVFINQYLVSDLFLTNL